MSACALAGLAALALALAPRAEPALPAGHVAQRPPEHPQEVFARRAIEALAEAEDGALEALVRAAPFRATGFTHDLLRQAALEGAGSWAFASARRVAEVLRRADHGAAATAVGAFDAARWRELDALDRDANRAGAEGRLDEALERAGAALAAALALGDPVLEARARRLLARVQLDRGAASDAEVQLARCVALDEELGLIDAQALDLKLAGDAAFRAGRYAAALAAYERSRACSQTAGEAPHASDLDVGALCSNLGRYGEARAALERGLDAARAASDARAEAYALGVLGALEGARGGYAEALRRLAASVEVARLHADAFGEAAARVQHAGLLSELGRTAEAEDALAPALAALAPGSLAHAFAELTLGLVRTDGGRAGEALPVLERAERALEILDHAAGAADARAQRARALLLLGRPAEAEALLAELAPRLAENDFGLALCRVQHGEALEALGRADAARERYAEALSRALRIDAAEAAWRARAGLGRIAEAQGRTEEALAAYEAALFEVEALRTHLGAPHLRQRFLADKLDLYRRAARLHARAGRLEQAFLRSEGARARTLLELSGAGVDPRGDRAHSPALDALRAAESDLLLIELRLTEALRQRCDAETRSSLVALRDAARARHAAALTRAALASPHGAAAGGLAEPAPLSDIRRHLPAHVALLEYVAAESFAAVLVVRRGGARFVELDATAALLDQLVARILAPLEDLRAGRTDVANLAFDAAAARALHAALIEPLARDLEGCSELWIVPDGPLWRLPFALLVSRRDKRPVDPAVLYSQHAGCRFLIQDLALVHLPCAGLLTLAPPSPRTPQITRIDVAAPEPTPDDARSLPAARAELAAIEARATSSTITRLVGPDATEHAFKRSAPLAGHLHLAVHAALDDRRPAFSRLALAPGENEDGWLHAFEIESLALPHSSVVLSACETAGTPAQGEGLLGLARAFLVAGSRSVVATHWLVDDEATSTLMQHYYAALDTHAPARALQQAQIATLSSRRPGLSHAHPFFWAGVTLIGRP